MNWNITPPPPAPKNIKMNVLRSNQLHKAQIENKGKELKTI